MFFYLMSVSQMLYLVLFFMSLLCVIVSGIESKHILCGKKTDTLICNFFGKRKSSPWRPARLMGL
jgi:hypothetical protein